MTTYELSVVQGLELPTVLEELALRSTGEQITGDSVTGLPVQAVLQIPSGTVVYGAATFEVSGSSQCGHLMYTDTAMSSGAQLVVDGQQVWAVDHDCELGLDHLAIDGTLSAEGERIVAEQRERARLALAAVDPPDLMIETPFLVFWQHFGEVVDEYLDGLGGQDLEDQVWSVVEPAKRQRRLFRR